MSPRMRWTFVPLAASAVVRVAAALVGAAGVACEAPLSPAGSRPLAPQPIYEVWWQQVEQCSGLSGELARVEWYVVPCEAGEPGFQCEATPDGLCGGEWIAPHTILLGGPNEILPDGYATDEFTVKHEMLHDLTGSSDHPDLFKNCHVALR